MLGFAVALRAQGVDVRMCAPPDFAEHLARLDVPMVAAGKSVRDLVHGATASGVKPSTPADAPRVAAELVDSQFETVAPAAQDCDALVATGLMPAGVRSIAETLGIPYVCVAFMPGVLPSPHQTPLSRPGKPFPPDADNQTMWDVDAERVQALYGAPLNAAPGVARTATGEQRSRPRPRRPTVAGVRPDARPVAWFAGLRRRADRRMDPA